MMVEMAIVGCGGDKNEEEVHLRLIPGLCVMRVKWVGRVVPDGVGDFIVKGICSEAHIHSKRN